MATAFNAADFVGAMENIATYMRKKMYHIAMSGDPPRPPKEANPLFHIELDWACEVMSAALRHRRK